LSVPASPKLSVQVLGRRVALLLREQDQFLMQYQEGARDQDFVSLTMPVRATPWMWPRDLPPFFRQNLPEGDLLSILREVFGSAFDGTDLSLLGLVGGRGIGRVSVFPEGVPTPTPAEPLDVSTLLHADFDAAYFDDLVRRYVRSAVSGVVPKFLTSEQPQASAGRATLYTERYIVKGSSQHKYMAFNEHHTLRVLARLRKVPVALTQLSDDGQTLLVERFDVDADGRPSHGLEDACSLLGLPPHEKYSPSLEQVLKATAVYLPDASRQAQLERLGYHILANFVVRNADCHSKNIALYYTGLDDVAYTPVYDLVTTQAYDGMRDRNPGLSIEGRKSWDPGKTLSKFFLQRLGIGQRRYQQMLDELCDAVVSTAHELIALSLENDEWTVIVRNMLWAWDQAMQSVRQPGSTLSLGPVIRNAGLGPPDRPPPVTRTGESPLLGARRRSPRVRKRKGS
jgi:serine/threonine-protein kinase HipA